jgi:hypothetical protein
MSSSAGGWLSIILLALCANLPFVNQRLFAAVGLKWARKPLWLRLVELFMWYVVAGLAGLRWKRAFASCRAGSSTPSPPA